MRVEMHELSLMENVVELIREDSRQRGIVRINKIRLVIGRLTMVMPDSMQFAFEVLSQDDLFSPGAVLEIDIKDARARCVDCENEFLIPENTFNCPGCQSFNLDYLQGHELNVDFYEGDEV